MHAVVDADSMVYAAGFIADKTDGPVHHACHALDMILNAVSNELNVTFMEVYITGPGGSLPRLAVYPEYKANRKNAKKPVHFDALREHLLRRWDAQMVNNMEADDIVSIRALQEQGVIVSIDKDLWNTPGLHYNWRKKQLTDVSEHDAWYNFYTQTLVGDVADNVAGIKGIGPKRASSILHRAKDHVEMYDFCLETYVDNHKAENDLVTACRTLWIARDLDEFGNIIPWEKPY